MNSKTNKGDKPLIWSAVIVGLLVIVAWFVTLFVLREKQYRGTFGDMFGSINALFSGLAFAGIIITILLQRRDLGLQRDELTMQREELHNTNIHFDRQNKVLLHQQYQTTFFSLLEGHRALLGGIVTYNLPGTEGWSNFYNDLKGIVDEYSSNIHKRNFKEAELTGKNPLYYIRQQQHSFDAVFGDLMTIITLINEKLNDTLYSEILYNTLTPYEKYFFGLYCDCCDDQYTKFLRAQNFDFLRYYKGQFYKYKFSQETYFPKIEIGRQEVRGIFQDDLDASPDFLNVVIAKDYDFYDLPLKLTKIELLCELNPTFDLVQVFNTEILVGGEDFVGDADNSLCIRTMNTIGDRLRRLQDGFYNFTFTFNFDYYNKIYSVNYTIHITCLPRELPRGQSGTARYFQVTHDK